MSYNAGTGLTDNYLDGVFTVNPTSGFVGINRDPGYELDVNGTINASAYNNLQWAQINNRPTTLSAFSNDLNLSFPSFSNVTTSNFTTTNLNTSNINSSNIVISGTGLNTHPNTPMVSDGSSGYFCSSSGTQSSNYYAFDSQAGSSWISRSFFNSNSGVYTGSTSTSGVYAGEWLQIKLPVPTSLQSYTLGAAPFNANPEFFYVLGSTTGTTWTLVDTQSNWWAGASNITFTPSNLSPYLYYRLVVNKIPLNSFQPYAVLREWTLTGLSSTYNTLSPNTTLDRLDIGCSNLWIRGSLFAPASNINHYVGNIASVNTGVFIYGSVAATGTTALNSVYVGNSLYHSGGPSNLIEIINSNGQIPYSRIVNAPAQPDSNAIVTDIVRDLVLAINSDSNAVLRLKQLGVFDEFLRLSSN